jgi:hypothetical protein
MPTYNSTAGDTAIAAIHMGAFFCVDIVIDVPTIIAAHATLTTNAKITAGDVIQIWDIPDQVIIAPFQIFETVTAGQASNTGDLGIAGGDELFDGVALDATAGTLQPNLVSDDWGPDNVTCKAFNATDTLDMKFVADATTGKYVLHLMGVKLRPAPSA